jgi:hypothetical protein
VIFTGGPPPGAAKRGRSSSKIAAEWYMPWSSGSGAARTKRPLHDDTQPPLELERRRLPNGEAAWRRDQQTAARDVDQANLEPERHRHTREPGNVLALPAPGARLVRGRVGAGRSRCRLRLQDGLKRLPQRGLPARELGAGAIGQRAARGDEPQQTPGRGAPGLRRWPAIAGTPRIGSAFAVATERTWAVRATSSSAGTSSDTSTTAGVIRASAAFAAFTESTISTSAVTELCRNCSSASACVESGSTARIRGGTTIAGSEGKLAARGGRSAIACKTARIPRSGVADSGTRQTKVACLIPGVSSGVAYGLLTFAQGVGHG